MNSNWKSAISELPCVFLQLDDRGYLRTLQNLDTSNKVRLTLQTAERGRIYTAVLAAYRDEITLLLDFSSLYPFSSAHPFREYPSSLTRLRVIGAAVSFDL
jgi:hypothetical protein